MAPSQQPLAPCPVCRRCLTNGGRLCEYCHETATLRAEVERLRADLRRSGAETAACLDYLKCEMGWENFRAEMNSCENNPAGVSVSERNAAKLSGFLADKNRGEKVLAEIDRLTKELTRWREYFGTEDPHDAGEASALGHANRRANAAELENQRLKLAIAEESGHTQRLIAERDEAKAIGCVCLNAFKALQMAAENKIDEKTFIGVVESSAIEMGQAADWLKAYTDTLVGQVSDLEAKLELATLALAKRDPESVTETRSK